jgi:hypothetical protein
MRRGGHVVEGMMLRAVVWSGGCSRSAIRVRSRPGRATSPAPYLERGWSSSGGGWSAWGASSSEPMRADRGASHGRCASLLRL